MSHSTDNDPNDMNRDELIAEVNHLRRTSAPGQSFVKMFKGIRKRSTATLMGLPFVSIAIGPDPELGELRGHARGIIAVGDIATGVLAVGGFSRGFFAIGGVAIGVIAVGGCALSLLLAMGGFAVGLLALGGLAIGGIAVGGSAAGVVAVGGLAVGYYAYGETAFGAHVISSAAQSPEAVEFFGRFFPNLKQ